ncbi:DNA polymerase III subunit gamma/tau [bacterium]|nr:DNA polymerase III subunit gamma/tau [bacterium]
MNKNYIPLYRKYRPQAIEQIVGQGHIKKALANAIQMDRISHAYLFTGPRGTGKTSTARIFAKSLNCQNGPTIAPCNECENCKNITNSIPIDVIEIDAASNRSVNDADEIIQKVALAPVQSRYKIYIIDEVHMLTNQAFNALLKTLEEPPKNVIFILATTEVHKVLDTIKSRCQRFDFKRITTDDIAKHLRYISDKEEINITDDALAYIAQNSAGGMRDSIALLDQLSVLNSTEEAISVDDINRLLGRLSFDSLTSLFNAIASSNQNEALNVLNDIYNQGNEPSQILSNLLEYLRNTLILKSVENASVGGIVQLNDEQIKILSGCLKNLETHQLVSLIDKCAAYIKELKLTSNPKLWLDVAILDMSNLVQNTTLEELQKRISMLESGDAPRPINISAYNTPPSPVMKQEIKKPVREEKTVTLNQSTSPVASVEPLREKIISQNATEEEVLNQPVPMSKPAPANGLKTLWVSLLENISSSPSRSILKQQAVPVKITQEEVVIAVKSPNWLKQYAPDGSKHHLVVEAANSLFSGGVKKVIVRAPEAGDDAIRAEQQSSGEDEAPAPAPKKIVPEKVQEPEINKEDVQDVVNAFTEEKTTNKSQMGVKHPDSAYHSDMVNNVMDLFEGKFID